jgi:2-succinyl-6-hydroxy-2,4-cyclohexadiene-1-carboxylate synthase
MSRIPINGVCMNVEVTGAGPPVIALHGFTGSLETWESFAAAAQSDYTIVLVDMLGHGLSDAPSDPERYCMEWCIKDLVALLDYLGLEQVHWLGYSMGGRVALSAAIALPGRTATLIAESASSGLATVQERSTRVLDDTRLADWLEEVGVERFVEYWEKKMFLVHQARLPVAVLDRVRAQRLRNTSVGIANSLRGLGTGVQPPLHRELSSLAASSLFIVGEEDSKCVAISGEMSTAVRSGQFCALPGAGHTVHLERPDLFNQAVVGFLAGNRLNRVW